MGCFSLHPRKNITTGEGGIVVTNNKKIHSYINSMKNHGIQNKNNKYIYIYPGYNYRLTDIQAVIGINQLKSINLIIARRKKIALLYNKLLSEFSWIKVPIFYQLRNSVYQSYQIIIGNNVNIKNLISYLKKNLIETNVGAQALHIQDFYKKKYNFKESDYPNSYHAFTRGIVLPIGQHIDTKDVVSIYKVFKRYNNILYG